MEEGGVRLTVRTIRAGSYKTEAEGRHQGFAHRLFKGCMSVLVNRNDTDILVDNLRDLQNLRDTPQHEDNKKSSA